MRNSNTDDPPPCDGYEQLGIVVPHQVNQRIIESSAERLRLREFETAALGERMRVRLVGGGPRQRQSPDDRR